MNKKILTAVILASMCVAAVAGATPMTEFKKGEGQIDLGAWQRGAKASGYGFSADTESKIGLIGQATYGLSDKWGVQYGYHDLTTGDFKRANDLHLGGHQHEINALYSFDPHAAAYIGWNQINANIQDVSRTNNIAQIGVVAKTALADKLDLYGNFAVGTKSTFMALLKILTSTLAIDI